MYTVSEVMLMTARNKPATSSSSRWFRLSLNNSKTSWYHNFPPNPHVFFSFFFFFFPFPRSPLQTNYIASLFPQLLRPTKGGWAGTDSQPINQPTNHPKLLHTPHSSLPPHHSSFLFFPHHLPPPPNSNSPSPPCSLHHLFPFFVLLFFCYSSFPPVYQRRKEGRKAEAKLTQNQKSR